MMAFRNARRLDLLRTNLIRDLGVKFRKIFASIAELNSIRIIIALATEYRTSQTDY